MTPEGHLSVWIFGQQGKPKTGDSVVGTRTIAGLSQKYNRLLQQEEFFMLDFCKELRTPPKAGSRSSKEKTGCFHKLLFLYPQDFAAELGTSTAFSSTRE